MQILANNNTLISCPYSFGKLKQDNPQVSFPANPTGVLLEHFGVYEVSPVDPPVCNPATQRVEDSTPIFQGNKWTQTWAIVPLTVQEQAAYQQSIKADIVEQTQERLDLFAMERGYDSILSACTYATSAIPKFQQEGQYCVTARDDTWASLYQILAEVEAGTRPMPTGFEAIEPLLPAVSWP